MFGEMMSEEDYSRLLRNAERAETRWLALDGPEFDSKYNRLPFAISHRLAEHPAFKLEPLLELCRRVPDSTVNFRTGVVPVDMHFETSFSRSRGGLTREEALNHIVDRQIWVALNNPEKDPEYRPIIEGLLGEIALRSRALDPWMTWYSTYIFISASGSITPYHMDREMNFLLQIRGEKTAQLWDPNDDVVMSPAQRDKLLAATGETRPTYHEGLPERAISFDLRPGVGIHHPFIAPHVVKTGPELSISLAITYRTRGSDVWADAHRLNHRLRALGLKPRAVRQNGIVDTSKATVMRAVRRARATVAGAAPRD